MFARFVCVPCWVFVRASFLRNPKPENPGKLSWNAPRMTACPNFNMTVQSYSKAKTVGHVGPDSPPNNVTHLQRSGICHALYEAFHNTLYDVRRLVRTFVVNNREWLSSHSVDLVAIHSVTISCDAKHSHSGQNIIIRRRVFYSLLCLWFSDLYIAISNTNTNANTISIKEKAYFIAQKNQNCPFSQSPSQQGTCTMGNKQPLGWGSRRSAVLRATQ